MGHPQWWRTGDDYGEFGGGREKPQVLRCAQDDELVGVRSLSSLEPVPGEEGDLAHGGGGGYLAEGGGVELGVHS